jgi:hypothetical protein
MRIQSETHHPTSHKAILAFLYGILITVIVLAAINWIKEPARYYPSWLTAEIVTNEDGETIFEDPTLPHPLQQKSIDQQRLRLILLLAFIFTSKILLQTQLTSCRAQAWLYFLVCLTAAFWIWDRMVIWDFWICETVYSKVIGTPLNSLAIPTFFFLYDQARKRSYRLEMLVLRIPVELLLMLVWYYVWGAIQLFCLGWMWI